MMSVSYLIPMAARNNQRGSGKKVTILGFGAENTKAMLQADALLRPRADWSVSAGSGITCTACEHEVKQLRGAASACQPQP